MAEIQIGFEWPVALNRYEIIDYGPGEPAARLKGKCIVAKPGRWELSRPFEFHKTLFAQFSELGDDEDKWLGFANSFGLLTVHASAPLERVKPSLPHPKTTGIGEPLSQWKSAIHNMARAVQAWQDDSLRFPEQIVRDISLSAALVEAPYNTFALKLLPHHLFGAMWLQFAQAVASDKPLRACDECGEWFEMKKRPPSRSPGKPEPHRFCSNLCRSRYHNRRIKEASS